MKIDPNRSVTALQERIDAHSDPRHKAMLSNYLEHLVAEVHGEMDAIMATLVPEPEYHFYSPVSNGEGPRGRSEVEAFYRNLFDNRMNVLERSFDRVLVTHDHIVSDGHMDHCYPGRLLADRGMDVDPAAWYLATYRICAILPYTGEGTDVLMMGEDTYTTGFPGPDQLVKLADDELPDLVRAGG